MNAQVMRWVKPKAAPHYAALSARMLVGGLLWPMIATAAWVEQYTKALEVDDGTLVCDL